MKVDIDFDEQPLIKALIDNVVAKIEEEFHKMFPRLRRDEVESMTEPQIRMSHIDLSSPLVENAEKLIAEKNIELKNSLQEVIDYHVNDKPKDVPTMPSVKGTNYTGACGVKSGDTNASARCNGNIRPSAYIIRNVPDVNYIGHAPEVKEGFYFVETGYGGGIILTPYHVLETNNA